jgi:cyclopropane fatty-acyl-phospholipid synthase-like methyltransferase
VTLEPLDDLLARLDRERQAADRIYNAALTALDRALSPPPVLPAAAVSADRARLDDLNQRWNILPGGAPPVDRSMRGRLAGFVWRLIGPSIQAQVEFNSAVVDHLNRTADGRERRAETAVRLRDALQTELQALVHFQSLLLQYLQTVTAYVDTKDRGLGAVEFRERLAIAEQRIAAMKREVDRVADGGAASARASDVPSAAVFTRPVDSVTYVGFEDRYRGASGEIRRRVEEYLPLLEGAADVVDVGCGRGELLTALRERGTSARGVDANAAMVEVCRSRGLDVDQGDAVSYLERQPDESIGAITAIQVVEHFDPAYLVRFLETAYHKLKSGGPIILETINAACWMAFFDTYIRDLTHQRPLHPDTLRYLVEASGFTAVDVRFRQPVTADDRLQAVQMDDGGAPHPLVAAVATAVNDHAVKLNARLFSSMDYVVIARR